MTDGIRCVYCQFYSDYNTNNMCEYCKVIKNIFQKKYKNYK